MKVNGIDISKYNAKQLSVDVQPPSILTNYEWMTGAVLPTEFKTEVQMGHLILTVYFKGKDRGSIIRSASEFMENFKSACDMELDGYAGKYRGFMVADEYEKKIAKDRYVMNLEFDGFFYDDEQTLIFDGVDAANISRIGTRDVPCAVEIYAKNALTNYVVRGFGEDYIIVSSLAAGKTLVIDGINGLVTIDGVNAFDIVNMWEFPKLTARETSLEFSSTEATVKISYAPMWI